MSKILFYRNDFGANAQRQLEDGYGGVGYYRIVQPYRHTKEHDVDIIGTDISKKKWQDIFKKYDIFWACYFSNPEEASKIYYYRDKYKKKVIIDLDDNYLDVLPSHHLYDRMKPTKKERAFTSTILSFADAITVSTEPLKQKIDQHMKKVFGLEKKIFVIPNMNEIKDWNFKPAKKNTDKIVIGYAGSNSHYDDMKMMFPYLAKVMDKYPNVYFESMGSLGKVNIELFTPFSESARLRSDILPSTFGFKEYPKHLSKHKWDIGIAPLADNAFTRCKSPIKFFEYSMYKIPTIASRVYPYFVPNYGREVITHEKTGLLVRPSEWSDALEDLILHEDKRKLLGQNAYDHVSKNWQYNDEYSDSIEKMLKSL